MERLANLRIFNKLVDDLAKICKVLGNPRHLPLLHVVADSQEGTAPRQSLVEAFSVGQSTVSRDLADLERVGLVDRERSGRRVEIRLTDQGKKVVDICRDLPNISELIDVSSDSNRLLLLEVLAESEGEVSFNDLHLVINDLLERSGRNSISTPLLSYHLRKVKEMGIIYSGRKYYSLSNEGKEIYKKVIDLLSAIP